MILNILDPFIAQTNRENIRFREELIVNIAFLRTHCNCCTSLFIKSSCLLNYLFTIFKKFLLALDFVINCLANMRNRVDILDFALCTKYTTSLRRNRYVRITTHRTFFHLAVADTNVIQRLSQCFYICFCFFTRMHVRFRYDFNKWCSRTVKVQ